MSTPALAIICVTALGLALIWAAVRINQQKEK